MPDLSRADRFRFAWLIAGAAAFAAAELGAGLVLGRFFEWGRAEALLFFAFRPWLLLVGGLLVARSSWRWRAGFYALALTLAGVGESLLLVGLGGEPWIEMLRDWAAGAVLAAFIDLLLQLGRKLGRAGLPVAAGMIASLFLIPGASRPYEALALDPPGPHSAAERPRLLLMTGLPIFWGEGGAFDPSSRPAAILAALEQEFEVVPIDYLDARTLGPGRLMLLAQPRLLEPVELVALDTWVRRGGRILILADPDLVWPTHMPLGDVSRPPPASLLSPLLGHWGIRLEPAERRLSIEYLHDGRALRRLVLAAPGRFVVAGGPCRLARRDFLASCRIGAGRATLVADADLLNDSLWVAPSPRGAERHHRLADNPLLVAGWLDRLAGRSRERAARPVRWQEPEASRSRALLFAASPILAAAVAAALIAAILRHA